MTLPTNVLDAQVQSLLALIDVEHERRREQLDNGGRERVRTMLREARSNARRKLGDAVQHERARLQEALQRTAASIETRQAALQHERTREMIELAWTELPDLLLARWRTPSHRRQWCEGALHSAGTRLRSGEWRIEIAPGADEGEHENLLTRLRESQTGSGTLDINGQLSAGLRIVAGGATLDASLEGLLSDRAAIEARLVAEWQRR